MDESQSKVFRKAKLMGVCRINCLVVSVGLGFIYGSFGQSGVSPEPQTNGVEVVTNSTPSTGVVETNVVAETNSPETTTHSVVAHPVSPPPPGFTVKKGFRIEQVAQGFDVCSPVSMAFDEEGRLFVAEMRDYPDRRGTNPHLGRVRVFQSSKGDGVFDSSNVFAEDLPLPSSVVCYDGGVFVAATPDIFFLKDTNGDGIADQRKKVLSGFGGANNLRPDALVGCLTWGMDNRIHGVTSGLNGQVSAADSGADPVELGEHDFSFDPRTGFLLLEAGPGQTGLSFDVRGRKFISSFVQPLRTVLVEPRYLLRNPYFAAPSELVDVISAARVVFSSAPTNKTGVTARFGVVPQWFTNARSCLVYQGAAFPSTYSGHAFIADYNAHLIHHAVLREAGLGLVAERAPDERASEFLISTDPLFHPTHLANGPEGALYVADFRDGGDNGKIYRILPENFRLPKPSNLARARTYDLVAGLANANGWHRETVSRLLYQKRDPSAVALLTNMLNNARSSLARLGALQVLGGSGALSQAQLLRGLSDSDERVREEAVRLSEVLNRNSPVSDALWGALRGRVADASIHVRYQLALTLGEMNRQDRLLPLAQLLMSDGSNPWFQAAVLSSVADGAGRLFAGLAVEPRVRNDAAGFSFLQRLASLIGVKGRADEIAQLLDVVQRDVFNFPQVYSILSKVGEGLARTGGTLSQVDSQYRLQRFESQALVTAADDAALTTNRVDAIRFLAFSRYTYDYMADLLLILLSPAEPQPIQSAVLSTLSRLADPRITTNVLSRWQVLSPAVREDALNSLLGRDDRVPALIASLQNGALSTRDFSPLEMNFLRTYPEDAVRQTALRFFGPVTLARPNIVDAFKTALRTAGVSGRGRQVFLARCAACHIYNGEGRLVGPELSSARALGRERLLSKILQPNVDLASSGAATVVKTVNGENLVGLLTDQNPTTITLRQIDGASVVLPRRNLLPLQIQPWSIMPDGLEQGLTVQDMASLLEYLVPTPQF